MSDDLTPTSPTPVNAQGERELVAKGRYSEAAAHLTAEIEELERTASDPEAIRHLAERRRVAARLWQNKLGRLDRALENWQRAFELEPERTESLAEARAIHASLG